ncbi:pyridoxal phosphate-dependent aminotransferase [Candidatus Gottesmanbacteria bacterium]|nr:pyridoxal phosphate-dependent aminotransferase [Candidatus Gottesmanbacteria bacterium]
MMLEVSDTHDEFSSGPSELIRQTCADEFRSKLEQGEVRLGIRSLTLLARAAREAMHRQGVPDADTAVTDATIGDIDVRHDPELYEALGLSHDGDTRVRLDRDTHDIFVAHEHPEADSLTSYQPEAIGFAQLRQAFADQLSQYGISFEKDETVVSYGSLSGIDNLLGTLFARARESGKSINLIFPSPGFSVIAAQAKRRGIPVTHILTDATDGYCVRTNDLKPALGEPSDDVSVLYLTPMNNPTSTVYDTRILKETVQKFHELRPSGIILVDLAYMDMIPEEQTKIVLACFSQPHILSATVFATSLSKSYGEPRLRAGALLTKNQKILHELMVQWQTVFASVSSQTEVAALVKLKGITKETREAMYDLFRKRQDMLLGKIERANAKRQEEGKPPLLDMSSVFGDIPLYIYAKLHDGVDFLDLFVQTGIMGVPGEVFGDDPKRNMIRLSVGMLHVAPEAPDPALASDS